MKRQEFDARTLQDHVSPHTYSDLLFKNALNGRARNTFGGLIRVEPHAHFTDAYQKVRNLLLSDDAEANSMPGLEIMADNVKCSHGATSGQIDEDEMFYLLARGIPAPVARQLLVGGFLNEVLERLPDAVLVAKLEALIAEKFARRATLIVCVIFARPVFSFGMDVSGTIEKILRQKSGEIWSISPDATVYDAIELMAEKNVGALLVMENGRLVGIVSERDYSRKVMLRGKTSRNSTVREIMTTELTTAHPRETVEECLRFMTEKRIRHLPVVVRWLVARRHFHRRPGQRSDFRPERDPRSTARLHLRRLPLVSQSCQTVFPPTIVRTARPLEFPAVEMACCARPIGRRRHRPSIPDPDRSV